MNYNQGHISGLADKFYAEVVPDIYKFISEKPVSSQFKIETISALKVLEQHKGHNLESFKKIRYFMDSFGQSIQRNKISGFTYPYTRFTFNFHDDLLNSVFNNFKQFDLYEFRELRGKLLSLRHIYDVYRTNVDYVFWEDPSEDHFDIMDKEGGVVLYTGLLANRFKRQNFFHSSNNYYYFIHDFSQNTIDLLKELLKNKKMKYFYFREKERLKYLHELLSQ